MRSFLIAAILVLSLPKLPNSIGDPEHHHEDGENWDDYEINMNNVVYVEDNAGDGNTDDDNDSHDEYEDDGDINEPDDGDDDDDDNDRRLITNILQKKRLIPNGIYDIEEMHADYRELVDPNNIFTFDGRDYYHYKDEDIDEAEEVDDGKEEKDDDYDKGQS
ncbi:phosphopantothenoylcysteine decarboxylase subunit VHS3 [Medicago truncatula]|uniref:Uncharacterized protein n=1 Tax=Medicago truncatula TaxID=3880 RepID=A0A072V6S7_MEDTR|nr:phosphopantothenoylcysteine decarboxylase subunit VHS3 [Medicago truncatula]KEH37532.1 hypothetical protein MTR_2g041050 [Medicago truncatula]